MSSILLQTTPPVDSQTAIIMACGAFALLYIFMRSKRKKSDPMQRSPAMSLSQQRSSERQMQDLLVELAEMSRQISGQLDTRAAKLEQLIRDADQRIAALNGHGASAPDGRSEPAPMFGIRESDSHTAPAPAAESTNDPRHAEIYGLADQGKSSGEIAAALNRPSGEVELILALRSRTT